MNSKLKKTINNEYFQIIFGLIFGIILTILFLYKETFLGVFAIIGVLFIIINIIRLIDALNGEKTNIKVLIKSIFIAPILLGLFIGVTANEFKHLGEVLNSSEIIKGFGLSSLCFVIFIYALNYLFQKKENRNFNFLTLIALLIVIPLLFISLITYINRLNIDMETVLNELIVYHKDYEIDKNESKSTQYWIFTNRRNKQILLNVESNLWNKLKKNDTIFLYLKKGNLGYKIISRIEKKPTANSHL